MKFRLVSDPAWLLTSYGRDIPACMAPPPAHCVCHLPRLGRGGWKYAPSPYGDMVLKFTRQKFGEVYDLFPSPYGDMVLKYG